VALAWRESRTVFHLRNPVPPGGDVEDPATGAVAPAFGGYLREGKHVPTPVTITILQEADMGRPSRITVGIRSGKDDGIDVTGTAVALS
jgi:predicted PhzF superfamily epimerase YddE/YHI9